MAQSRLKTLLGMLSRQRASVQRGVSYHRGRLLLEQLEVRINPQVTVTGPTTLHAGDKVQIAVTASSTDTDEVGENDGTSLDISINGTVRASDTNLGTVANVGVTTNYTYQATQPTETLSFAFNNDDGDEVATVAITLTNSPPPPPGALLAQAPTFSKVKFQPGIDYNYQVIGGALPQSASVAFYWASSSSLASAIGSPLYTTTIPAGTAVGSYSQPIPLSFASVPANAQDLLMVVDPGTANQQVTSLGLQLPGITPQYQNQPGSSWAPGGFSNPTNSTKLLQSPKGNTIAESGCNLTALAMMLSYAGMNYTPQTLNDFLLSTSVSDTFHVGLGFQGGDPDRAMAVALAGINASSFSEWEPFQTSDPQALRAALVNDSAPLEVKVTNPSTGKDHYVLVTGLAANGDFTIDDPGYPSGSRAQLIQSYGSSFTSVGYIKDPPDLSVLSFSYLTQGPAASITITDPNGKVTTIDPNSNQSSQQIPNSFVSVDRPLEDLSGQIADNSTLVTVDIYTPVAGEYKIQTGDNFASTSSLKVGSVGSAGATNSLQTQLLQGSGGQVFEQVFVGPTPTAITASSGSAQSALVNTAFASPLLATVTDTSGNPVPNVTVTFTGPGSGAGVTFPTGNTVVTNSLGQAAIKVTANGIGGSFIITASVSGVTTLANFGLTNTTSPPPPVSPPPVSPPPASPPPAANFDKLGAYRSSDGSWSLDSDGGRTFNPATSQTFLHFSPPGITGVAGDWNGTGRSQIGDFSNGVWHLDLAGTGAPPGANETFQFGQAGDQPVVGDWDGNPSGRDELGVFRTAPDGITGEFILDIANHKTMDSSNLVFTFGLGTDHIVVGDWNGTGTTEVGVYRDAKNYLAADAGDIVFSINSNGDHATFTNFVFGLITDQVVIGDWTGSGTSKVGVYRDGSNGYNAPGTALFTLDSGALQFNAQSQVFLFGLTTDQFVAGNWSPTPPLLPAQFAANGRGPGGAPALTQAQLEPVLQQALFNWEAQGASAAQLEAVQVRIGTLDDNLVGWTSGNQITLDATADGWGWNTGLSSAAAGKMDLLTVVEHELGHELGLSDVDPATHPDSLMAATLPVGVRRSPTAALDALFARSS